MTNHAHSYKDVKLHSPEGAYCFLMSVNKELSLGFSALWLLARVIGWVTVMIAGDHVVTADDRGTFFQKNLWIQLQVATFFTGGRRQPRDMRCTMDMFVGWLATVCNVCPSGLCMRSTDYPDPQ